MVRFSIVISVTPRSAYLVPLTLDSIFEQVGGNYEVIVVDGTKGGLVLEKVKILPAKSTHLFAMMNQGMQEATGDYVHFLQPGEFYISHHVLSFVAKFTQSFSFPELVYGGCFVRHRFSAPDLFLEQITLENLKKGEVPGSLQALWLRRDVLLSMGGFSEKYQVQGGFDMICRYYISASLRKAFMRRVLTDYEYRKPPSRLVLKKFSEKFSLVLKHFGLSFSILPWVMQNYLHLFRWWWKMVASAFWKQHVNH